jgi:ribosomal-protein-serine acetyltransferase
MFSHRLDADSELRLLDESVATDLFALTDRNRAYLREWMPWIDATKTVDDTRKFIRTAMEQYARGDGFNAAIVYQGAIAGCIGYHKIDRANLATSLGYWVSADLQGRGLATMATRALVDHAIGGLGLNRVEIRCGTANAKSRRVPEKLGFTLEGVVRQAERLYDRYIDLAVYGMLAEQWGKKPS